MIYEKSRVFIRKQISKLRSQGAKDMDNALVVQNPKMEHSRYAGKQIDKQSKLKDYDIGNFTAQYTVGSSVKGGDIISTGYQNKAINVGETMVDEPLKLRWFNLSVLILIKWSCIYR